jgi:RNA polymerase sigma factor (sigma-70 family)
MQGFRPASGRLRLYAVDLNALYHEHSEALTRYLTRLTGDRDSAADAAQEAFSRLLSQPPARNDNLRAWLYTVATNVVRDGWKKQQTALRLVQHQDGVPTTTASPDPHDLVERSERQRAVRKVLDRLSARDRTVLLMREEGFSHREIAAAVDTTTKSVGTMIARALRKFADELEATGTII